MIVKTAYEATLNNNGYDVTVGASKDYVSQFVRYVSEENYDGIDSMLAYGYLAKIPDGTKINIASAGISISQVDILEGDLKGYSVFVITEYIN